MAALDQALAAAPKKPALIVSDSLFSMEGTVVDVAEMLRVARKHGARVMLDESHALGVMGPTGAGVAEQAGLLDQVDLIMGTFSKSFAAQGGFVAGDADVIDGLRHGSRPYIFSASLAPATVAAVEAALAIARREPERRARLLANARFLAEGLRALGYEATWHGGAIVPISCGSEMLTVALFHKLFEEGVFVNPVLHPAVPKGGELLRTSVMATCDRPLLERALEIFARSRTRTFPSG
jgi:8-amino-7-oxononanoate synthase